MKLYKVQLTNRITAHTPESAIKQFMATLSYWQQFDIMDISDDVLTVEEIKDEN
jgi:hypothetical protein